MFDIAIDGPSGAGKSTIAKALAKRLGITYLDTGAMYRAVALYALKNGVDPNDEPRVNELLPQIRISIGYENGTQRVTLGDEDVSLAIREHAVSKAASDISKLSAVRTKLVDMQREIASRQSVVLDGRDITSVVLPNAKYKFFLTASPEVRARRRALELSERGCAVEYEKILSDIIDRDYNDSHRSNSPLVCTADSVLVDSSDLNAEQVLELIISYIKE